MKASSKKSKPPAPFAVATLPRVNSGCCHEQNRVWIHPVCALPNGMFLVADGWRLIGWTTAPTTGSGPHAIIYEKVTPAGSIHMGTNADFEPGIYWGHGNADAMIFCPQLPPELEEEIGPWL